MRRRIVAGIVLTVVPVLAGLALHHPEPAVRLTRCEEDQPCWDCETMGNLVCGPTFSETLTETMPGPFVGWGGAQ